MNDKELDELKLKQIKENLVRTFAQGRNDCYYHSNHTTKIEAIEDLEWLVEQIQSQRQEVLDQLFEALSKLKWSSAFVVSEFENNIKLIKQKYGGV